MKDLLITNGYLITMDEQIPDQNADILIHDHKIEKIGRNLAKTHTVKTIIDAKDKLILPGFINTHTHAAMTLLRGLADDLPLMTWLNEHIWPAEAKLMNAQTVKLGTELAITEMIASGTTTFNDMYFFGDEVAKVAQKAGIRAIVTEAILDFPTPKHQRPELALADCKNLIQRWQNHPLIDIAIACHAPYSCSGEILKSAQALARKHQKLFHIHVSETESEIEQIQNQHRNTPVGYLNDLGILGNNVVMAHAVHLSKEDRQLLKDHHVGIAHNPESNMKLASGTAPIPDLLKEGLKIGLATDGAASNNNLNMIDEMKAAALLHKLVQKDPTVISAKEALYMATMGGAKVLGLDHKIGSLTPGKDADLILVNTQEAHMQPLHNPVAQVVYSMEASDVDTVIIYGKIVMENRSHKTIDKQQLLTKIHKWKAQECIATPSNS